MLNIIETLQNYLTRELLLDCISAVKWPFTVA